MRLGNSALRRARVAATLAYAVQGLRVALLVTLTPAIKAALGLSDTQLGLLLVAIPVVAVVGTIVAGTLAPRIGGRAVLRIAGPIVPASTVVVGFSDNLALSAAALIIFGIALGAVQIAIAIIFDGLLIYGAAGVSRFLSENPTWMAAQRWILGGALALIALKLATESRA